RRSVARRAATAPTGAAPTDQSGAATQTGATSQGAAEPNAASQGATETSAASQGAAETGAAETGGKSRLAFHLEVTPGGPMAPMIELLMSPLLEPAAEDLAVGIRKELERQER